MCLKGDDIKTMKISVCFVLLFCCVATVTAQEKVIDKTEFDALVASGNNHQIRWKDEKYRMTVSTSSKAIGRPQTDWSSKMIFEFGSANEKRTVTASTFGGKPNPIQEAILIGNWKYTRSGNNSWSRGSNEPSRTQANAEAPVAPSELIGAVLEYRYLGKSNLAGRQVDVYQRTERAAKVSKKTGEDIDSDAKATYWFGEDGALLKNEFRSESRSATLTTQTLIIMEWAIDPSIVITEPVIAPEKP